MSPNVESMDAGSYYFSSSMTGSSDSAEALHPDRIRDGPSFSSATDRDESSPATVRSLNIPRTPGTTKAQAWQKLQRQATSPIANLAS